MFYDAHNHLQDDRLRPHWERIAADREAAGIGAMVVNGTCKDDWPVVAELARRFPWVRPSYGLHPWDVGNASPGWRDALQRQLDADPRAGVGEIGLDRWILERARPDDPRLAALPTAQPYPCGWVEPARRSLGEGGTPRFPTEEKPPER